jgi:glycosyltransferase involved in cell wall biosynthesis
MYNGQTICLVLPAKNEELNLPNFFKTIPSFVDEVILIDGNSADATYELAKAESRVNTVVKQRQKGKGAGLSLGYALSKSDIIVTLDVDGSMNLNELQRYLDPIQDYDLVKGSRYLTSEGAGSDDLTIIRNLGNKALTMIANYFFNLRWTDLNYGYFVFKRSSLDSLGIANFDSLGSFFSHKAYGQGFEIETLIFTRAAKQKLKIKEIPSFESKRVHGGSNLKAVRDGVRVFIALLIEATRRPAGK